MLAKDAEDSFDSEEWLFEIKWDGYRAITEKEKNKILLYSRNGINFQYTYPVIFEQLKFIKQDVVLDGVTEHDVGPQLYKCLAHGCDE